MIKLTPSICFGVKILLLGRSTRALLRLFFGSLLTHPLTIMTWSLTDDIITIHQAICVLTSKLTKDGQIYNGLYLFSGFQSLNAVFSSFLVLYIQT